MLNLTYIIELYSYLSINKLARISHKIDNM